MEFFSIATIWMIFMEGKIDTYHFFDFENFLHEKDKITLADFVSLGTLTATIQKATFSYAVCRAPSAVQI
jgi:hypothetical protein